MEDKKLACCFCGKEIIGWGNNPFGAMKRDSDGNFVDMPSSQDDRCCDECNAGYVIPGRIYKMHKVRHE